VVLLGSDVEVMDAISGTPQNHLRIRNGALTNYIHVVTPKKKTVGETLMVSEPAFEIPLQAQDLANRLRKNGRQLRKYIEQENIQAYRLYDRDLPEFNFSIDIYGDQVLVQEYKPPKTVDENKAEQRRGWTVSVVRSLLNAHREQVHLRTRQPQKGKSQYQKLGKRKKMHVISEGQGIFLVNLEAYLDSGLFLDHRPIRLRIAKEADGKRFLNLFAYTGSATVHAALGGARSSVTVDASNTYLGWAAENLALNGFASRHHRVERADAMKWLEATHEQFDLIFCDPPTFSNSKNRDDFTVQRDHGDLIRLAMRRLEPGGTLYFSCNFRRFELHRDIEIQFDVKDISRGSVPPDFQRHQDIHYLFAIRHREKKAQAN
jgi:23S rRNA (guanine2445-N2)-methyltransferase / 23S rRNA (guanine2069-N7)-methyltransferase